MSNPKRDNRGSTLTSCHSFNVLDCDYNCGCSGYARDDVTFIVFTASDPDKPETLNNRKTTRQLFMYKPFNGLLLQSRLYNTYGGTCGAQTESKLYRDLVQRELSELEGVPNLWKTEKYCGNKHAIHIHCGNGFGGYADWPHPDFDAKISIRQDCADNFEIATTTTANSVRSAKIILLKLGKFSTVTVSVSKSATIALTNITVFANIARNISTKAK